MYLLSILRIRTFKILPVQLGLLWKFMQFVYLPFYISFLSNLVKPFTILKKIGQSLTIFLVNYRIEDNIWAEQSSFSKLSVASPTSQLIIQPFPRFSYVTAHSPTLPLLHLRHSSFSNPSFASPTSQDFHLRHLASRLWSIGEFKKQLHLELREYFPVTDASYMWIRNPFVDGLLTLIVPRASEIGYTQPCIKFRGDRQLILFILKS